MFLFLPSAFACDSANKWALEGDEKAGEDTFFFLALFLSKYWQLVPVFPYSRTNLLVVSEISSLTGNVPYVEVQSLVQQTFSIFVGS